MTVAQKSKTNLQLNCRWGPDSEGALCWPMVHILWEHNFLLQETQRVPWETALSMPASWECAGTSQGADLEQPCFMDWWNLGPCFECLQGSFFWALFDKVSAFCSLDCHPFLLSSFQLSYHPIGMDTYTKTVNHEHISRLFVILEVSIKILSASDTLMGLIYQHKNKYLKANVFALFWYIQRVIWPADSVKPGFHNFSGVDYLISDKDELTTSSHSTGCKNVCPGTGHSASWAWHISDLYHFVMVNAKKNTF